MSTLKVDTILKRTGTGTITVGQSGDTITIPSGATLNSAGTNTLEGISNTPSFMAYAPSGTQSIASGTQTKVNFSTEFFDTDSKYDNSSMRFTPTVAGKYLITAGLSFATTGDGNYVIIFIYKNGSELLKNINRSPSTADNGVVITGLVDLDADDYVEIFAKQNTGSNQNIQGSNTDRTTFFGGHKLI
tara:strand:+ start:480 stop:1043 length:564 start_codon:yes stop_codon:yes gene_type:complete